MVSDVTVLFCPSLPGAKILAGYIAANVQTVVDQIPQLDESVVRVVLGRVNGELALRRAVSSRDDELLRNIAPVQDTRSRTSEPKFI